MRFGDMPPNPEMKIPENMNDWVLQATLPFGDNFLRLSDTFGEFNDATTERISIVMEGDLKMVENAFTVLEEEGEVKKPLESTFFSPAYGSLFDKFGVMWSFAATPEE